MPYCQLSFWRLVLRACGRLGGTDGIRAGGIRTDGARNEQKRTAPARTVSAEDRRGDEIEAPPREQLACILVHGFNGDPGEMRELEGLLRARGHAASTLLLPGHGSTLRDFAASGWDDWYGAVLAATRTKLEWHDRVVLVGHSLGGALVLAVAAHEPRLAGVAALCPPVRLHPRVGRLVARVHRVVRYVPSGFEDIRDRRTARGTPRRVYRWTSLAAVRSLYDALDGVWAALPRVRCPTLVVCARHDHVVPMRDGVEAYRRIGAKEKALVVLERSFHQVTRDVERGVVFERVLDLCQHVKAQATGAASP